MITLWQVRKMVAAKLGTDVRPRNDRSKIVCTLDDCDTTIGTMDCANCDHPKLEP